MAIYILTLRENNEGDKLIRNYGVFSKRYLAMSFILKDLKKDVRFHGGRFTFTSVQELSDREHELDFNPTKMKVYENDFFAAYTETSFLI